MQVWGVRVGRVWSVRAARVKARPSEKPHSMANGSVLISAPAHAKSTQMKKKITNQNKIHIHFCTAIGSWTHVAMRDKRGPALGPPASSEGRHASSCATWCDLNSLPY